MTEVAALNTEFEQASGLVNAFRDHAAQGNGLDLSDLDAKVQVLCENIAKLAPDERQGCPSPLKLGHYFSTGKGLDMARKRHSDEDILKLLREIEVKLSAGSDVASACRGVGISDATYYNWRKRFGGMGRSQLSEMRSLEKENARLKKIVAELELDKLILKESLSHLKPRA
jgi:putative transposase